MQSWEGDPSSGLGNQGSFFSDPCLGFLQSCRLRLVLKLVLNIRGAIKIENRENLGQCPNRGGGRKKTEMSQFQFGNFENRGGGLYFSKMSQFQLFDSVFCIITFIRNV